LRRRARCVPDASLVPAAPPAALAFRRACRSSLPMPAGQGVIVCLALVRGASPALDRAWRLTGRSTRHDPLPRPLHTGKFGPHGASTSPKHHAAAARSG